ncbi:MAG: cytochrome c [Gammaproteobacteria bacterium]|nr:cytochrome c [Gammaproteobacteria bacterium]
MFTKISRNTAATALGITLLAPATLMAEGYGGPYGFGTTPSAEEIAMVDIDVMPDGRGAPPGSGTHKDGKAVYASHCLACHGANLEGNSDLGAAALIGGRGSLTSGKPKKTIESYWPHASTVFDYVKRAMPFNAPGSLSDDDVYRVVAYILGEANILDKSATLNATSLAAVEMPNKDGFIPDPRPDIFNYD